MAQLTETIEKMQLVGNMSLLTGSGVCLPSAFFGNWHLSKLSQPLSKFKLVQLRFRTQDDSFFFFLFQKIIAIVLLLGYNKAEHLEYFAGSGGSVERRRVGHPTPTVHVLVPLPRFPPPPFLSPFIRCCVGDNVTKRPKNIKKKKKNPNKTKWAPTSCIFKPTEAAFAAQRRWFTRSCVTRLFFVSECNGSHGVARNKKKKKKKRNQQKKKTTARFLITPICMLNCALQANRRIFIRTPRADKCFLRPGKWLPSALPSSR